MKKIRTLFERDWQGNRALVLDGPPLVDLAGATATRKYDGTACLVRDGKLYKRYDAKAGRTPPAGFELVESDATTGHHVGWVPVGEGPEDKWFHDAPCPTRDGTYELIGPKVQGNPEQRTQHAFIPHGMDVLHDVPIDFAGLQVWLTEHPMEGVVWWKDGQPIAKIKRRDFGLPWPVTP